MLPIVGSLIIGVVVGFLGQRSRMCFIGGLRNFLMIRDKSLLKGAIAFFTFAWLTVYVLTWASSLFPALGNALKVKYILYPSLITAISSKFGLVSFIGGVGLGFFSIFADGCPLRQHVLAGQGRFGSIIYLAGLYCGIIVFYLFTAKFIARFI
jgi:hypothetical protein